VVTVLVTALGSWEKMVLRGHIMMPYYDVVLLCHIIIVSYYYAILLRHIIMTLIWHIVMLYYYAAILLCRTLQSEPVSALMAKMTTALNPTRSYMYYQYWRRWLLLILGENRHRLCRCTPSSWASGARTGSSCTCSPAESVNVPLSEWWDDDDDDNLERNTIRS
jgi:hypothetical protein